MKMSYEEALSAYAGLCFLPARDWRDGTKLAENARGLIRNLSFYNPEIPKEGPVTLIFKTEPCGFVQSLNEQREEGYTTVDLFRETLSAWAAGYKKLSEDKRLPLLSSLIEISRTEFYQSLEERILTNTCQPIKKILQVFQDLSFPEGPKETLEDVSYGIFEYLPIIARDYQLMRVVPEHLLGKNPTYTMVYLTALLRAVVGDTCAVSVAIKEDSVLITLLAKPSSFTINQGLNGTEDSYYLSWQEHSFCVVQGVYVDSLWELPHFMDPELYHRGEDKLAPHDFLAWKKAKGITLENLARVLYSEGLHREIETNLHETLLEFSIGDYKLKVLRNNTNSNLTVVNPLCKTVMAAVHSLRKYGPFEDIDDPIKIDHQWGLGIEEGVAPLEEYVSPFQGGARGGDLGGLEKKLLKDLTPDELIKLKQYDFEKMKDQLWGRFKEELVEEQKIKKDRKEERELLEGELVKGRIREVRKGVPDEFYGVQFGARPEMIWPDEFGTPEGREKTPKDRTVKETPPTAQTTTRTTR